MVLIYLCIWRGWKYSQTSSKYGTPRRVKPSRSSFQGAFWNIWQSVGGGQWDRSSVSTSCKASSDSGAPYPSPLYHGLVSARSGPQPPSSGEGKAIGWWSGLLSGLWNQAAPRQGHPPFPNHLPMQESIDTAVLWTTLLHVPKLQQAEVLAEVKKPFLTP